MQLQILIKISNNAICNINSDHANNGNIDQPGGSGYVLRNSHVFRRFGTEIKQTPLCMRISQNFKARILLF